jgi:hypothetical protein
VTERLHRVGEPRPTARSPPHHRRSRR